MSFPSPDNCITMHGDNTAIGQYIAVTKDAAGLMDLPTVDRAIIGVAQQGIATNDTTTPVSVCFTGMTYGIAAGVMDRGVAGVQPLMITAAGRFVLHGGGVGDVHVANLMPSETDAALGNTAAGDRIRIVLIQNPVVT